MKADDPKRMKQLLGLIQAFPKLWKWPKLKVESKKYPHHNEQEMARRSGQTQHHNQVKIDRETKRQVA